MKTFKTDREIFDFVKAHLLKQNKKATDASICVYHSRDGSKCAVGCLIPDECHSSSLEGLPYCSPSVSYILKKVLVFGEATSKLLSVLQICHDTVDVEDWAAQLARIEKDFFNS